MFWVLKNRLVLLSTHNICFGREIRKIIFSYGLLSGGLTINATFQMLDLDSGEISISSLKLLCLYLLQHVLIFVRVKS